nr:protein SRC2 homolog [Tanacetum cinerariifolium]
IGGNRRQERRTPVDKHGLTNPAWHHTIKYVIDESGIHHHGSVLVIKLYCKRLLGDRYIGEVHKSLNELYNHAYQTGGNGAFCSAVQIGSAVSQGQLYVSYNFGEKESMEHLMRSYNISDYLFINPNAT